VSERNPASEPSNFLSLIIVITCTGRECNVLLLLAGYPIDGSHRNFTSKLIAANTHKSAFMCKKGAEEEEEEEEEERGGGGGGGGGGEFVDWCWLWIERGRRNSVVDAHLS
jgi:hypothetical protein